MAGFLMPVRYGEENFIGSTTMALAYGPGEIDSADWRSRHEALLKRISVSVAAGGGGGGGGGSSAPPIASVARSVLSASAVKISATPQAFAANTNRLKVRITNNTGPAPIGGGIPDPYGFAGIPNPYGSTPIEPCYVIIGYAGNALSTQSFDQIAGPGRSIELDAPALGFSVAVLSGTPASVSGGVTVTSYLA